MRKQIFNISAAGIIFFAILTGGCGDATTNTSNTSQANLNATNASNMNAVSSSVASPTTVAITPMMETDEPNEYSATMQLTAQTTGRNMNIPPVTMNVAREGEKRRVYI